MEEKKKKFPSLPSNYVTLQQLQERRVKEQEQRQKEKEEEEEQRRKFLEEKRLKEEHEKRREQEEEERKLLETQKAKAIGAKTSGRSNRGKNPRNLSKRERRICIGPDMQKGVGGCVAFGISVDRGISDEGQKPEESKHEKKKNSKKKTMTQTTEEGSGAGVLNNSQAENGHGNQIPVEPKEENKRVRKKKRKPKVKEEEASTQRIRGRTRQGSKSTADEKAARASGVKKDKNNLTVTVVETARELEDLAVSEHHDQKEGEENRGGSMAVRAGSGSYCGGPRLRKDWWFGHGSSMWVKKGETSDANGIQKAEAKPKPKPCVS